MDCPAIYSENVYDFILEGDSAYMGAIPLDAVCRYPIGSRYEAVYVPKETVEELNIFHYSYPVIPGCYSLLAEGNIPSEYKLESCITPILNNSAIDLNGSGVIVGFVDTGIDLKSEAFQYVGGASRVAVVWDQTNVSEDLDSYQGYGSIYTKKIINERLNQEDALLPSDELGHGSYLAGIVAARDGIATQADIAVVKLKECKNYLREYYFIPEYQPAYQENDIMAGVQFLVDYAASVHKPLVICLAIGTNMGSHTGGSYLGRMLSRVSLTGSNMVVVAAGNEALRRHHYLGELHRQAAVDEVEIQVGENVTGFWVECWNEAPQAFTVNVISPNGEKMMGINGRQFGTRKYLFRLENTMVYQSTRSADEQGTQKVAVTRFERPTAGIWKLEIVGTIVTTGVYHLWLPMEGQLSGNVVFIRSNPDTTITEPANAIAPLTVTAYDMKTGGIFIQAGRGYTANQQIKPDLAAPGVDIVSPYRNEINSSTCAAAAIACGAAVLYMQWIVYRLGRSEITGSDIKYGLILGTKQREEDSYPNREWGYGKLCLLETFLE